MPSASVVFASATASESASPFHSESASVSTTYESSPSGSASISASYSESLDLSIPISTSASISAQFSSEGVHTSATPEASRSESYAVSPTPSASAMPESVSVSVVHAGSNDHYSEPSPTVPATVAGGHSSQPSSAVESVSAAGNPYFSSVLGSASAFGVVSVDYIATGSMAAQSSSYHAGTQTPSVTTTPLYNQGSASVTTSASYFAASSSNYVISTGLYSSSDLGVSQSASSFPASASLFPAHVDASSAFSDVPTPAHISSSAVSSYSVPVPSSSAPYSDSSMVHVPASSNPVYPESLVSSTVIYSGSSQYQSSTPSNTEYVHSTAIGSSAASSYYPAPTSVHSFGSSASVEHLRTKPNHSQHPDTKPYATPTPSTSVDSQRPWHSTGTSYPVNLPAKSIDYKGSFSAHIPARSSSIPSYPKDVDYLGGNAHPTGFYPVTTPSKPKGPKTTSAPCITVPWSSQSGYIPITKTYTTTTIRTISKCPDTAKSCPPNLSTKTYITTETKTRTNVVATPSSPPVDNKSKTSNKESDKKTSAPPSKETGKIPSPLKGSSSLSQSVKSTSGKDEQPAKATKPILPSQPPKNTEYLSQPSKSISNSPQPPKETRLIQSTHSMYAPPKISLNPSVPTSVPPYPTGPSAPASIKACSDMKCSYVAVSTGTKPLVGTGASTTLKTSIPSVSVCFSKDCKASGTPTGYKPAEFTGAASGEFVSSMVGAGAMIVALARFF